MISTAMRASKILKMSGNDDIFNKLDSLINQDRKTHRYKCFLPYNIDSSKDVITRNEENQLHKNIILSAPTQLEY